MLALSSQATQTSLCAIKNEEGRDVNISIKRTQTFDHDFCVYTFAYVKAVLAGEKSPTFQGMWNHEFWNAEYSSRNPESH